jgi:Flp pilus assembly pilin Flp
MMCFAGLRGLAADRNGSAAIEYAILAAGIGLTLAVTVSLLGDRMVATYGNIADAMIAAIDEPDTPPPCPAGKNQNNKVKMNGKASCKS